ncbi:MAG: carbohydrate kinase family protein [Candidatus Jorgensenbacteria bacterium]|nr:carbohydrate kinase family protein [Candidatus Jorgensenbacteria bacterium]
MFDIITIGTATRDVFLKSKLFKILRAKKHLEKLGFITGEAECFALGSKIEIEDAEITVGGGATNTAVTFARYGLKTASLIRIGNDPSGDEITSSLKKEKIEAFVVRDAKRRTAYSTILLSSGGERTILVYRGASESLEEREVPFSKLNAKWAYIAPGGISFPVIEKIVATLKKNNTFIAFNPSKHYIALPKAKLHKILHEVDIVLVNREEASRITGVSYENTRGIFKKFDDIVPGIAVMTDGKKGAFVSDGSNIFESPAFHKEKFIDSTGAGDAFSSAFVVGIMKTKSIEEAIRMGMANSASVVEYVGAQKGILHKREYHDARWKKLAIKVNKL